MAAERRQRRRLRPTLMALEDRRLLSTFSVTSTADPPRSPRARCATPSRRPMRPQLPARSSCELGSGPATVAPSGSARAEQHEGMRPRSTMDRARGR